MADMIDERYSRQLRLAEVGSPGQARIHAHRAELADGPSAGVALAYLERAGVGSVSIERRLVAPVFPHQAAFQFTGPRAVATGAHAALVELRKALFGTKTEKHP